MDTCPICMENFDNENVIETKCSHRFHINCLAQWREQNSCPVCRAAIDETMDVRGLRIEPNDEDEKEIALDIEQKEILEHENDFVDEENRNLVMCCVCQNDIALENAINCNICFTSYFCSDRCMNAATMRQHTCEFVNIDPSDVLFAVQTFP